MPRIKPEPNPIDTDQTPDLFDPTNGESASHPPAILAELAAQEAIIEATHGNFIQCGSALATIESQKLFEAAGDQSFADYLKRRWSVIDERRSVIIGLRQLGKSTRQIAEQVGVSSSQVHRDLTDISTVPQRDSSPMPDTVIGKDNKKRAATTPQTARVPQAQKKSGTPEKPSHPARFSEEILIVIAELLDGYQKVLDPFAGVGGIHILAEQGWDTVGIEIEPKWANQNARTKQGNALDLPFPDGEFDAIATSPTYGNRLADNYQAADPEARHSYVFDYGAALNPDNSGTYQWGDKYRKFHERAWLEATRVLRPGGRFVLNIKDHIRESKWQDVAAWHIQELFDANGLDIVAIRPVASKGMPSGANADARAPAELVIAFEKKSNGG
jgi:SAM-dependent methyltransferase